MTCQAISSTKYPLIMYNTEAYIISINMTISDKMQNKSKFPGGLRMLLNFENAIINNKQDNKETNPPT